MNSRAWGTLVASLAAISGLGFLLAKSNSIEAKPTEPESNPTEPKASPPRRASRTGGRGSKTASAPEMARAAGIDPKAFRQALRDEDLPWHDYRDPWIVFVGSPEHKDMQRVLARLQDSR